MKGKVIGTYTTTFKDGTVAGILCVERNDVDNLNGVVCQPFNISLDNLPVKNISELIGKNIIVSDSGYPKYTWAKEVYVI